MVNLDVDYSTLSSKPIPLALLIKSVKENPTDVAAARKLLGWAQSVAGTNALSIQRGETGELTFKFLASELDEDANVLKGLVALGEKMAQAQGLEMFRFETHEYATFPGGGRRWSLHHAA